MKIAQYNLMVGVCYKLLSYLYFGIDCHNNCLADVPVVNPQGLQQDKWLRLSFRKITPFKAF